MFIQASLLFLFLPAVIIHGAIDFCPPMDETSPPCLYNKELEKEDVDEIFITSHGHVEIVETKRTRADFDAIRMELMTSLSNNYSTIAAFFDNELISLDVNIFAKSSITAIESKKCIDSKRNSQFWKGDKDSDCKIVNYEVIKMPTFNNQSGDSNFSSFDWLPLPKDHQTFFEEYQFNDDDDDDQLGVGAFGIVYRGIRLEDDLPVAIKVIRKDSIPFSRWCFIGEIKVPLEYCLQAHLSRSSNAAVVELLDGYEMDGDKFMFVMELIEPSSDLDDWIHYNGPMEERAATIFFRKLIQAVNQCHQAGVCHRDIKEANIIIDLNSMEPKLIDFGFASHLNDSPYQSYCGTSGYMAPEIESGEDYEGILTEVKSSRKFDGIRAEVYSLGVVFYDLIFGAIAGKKVENKTRGEVSKKCRQLILQMLEKKPEKRPNLDEILRHPCLQ